MDECAGVYNGGCEEVCINIVGSFHCECTGNKTLEPDGFFCRGKSFRQQRHRWSNASGCLLVPVPVHCFSITLIKILLSCQRKMS